MGAGEFFVRLDWLQYVIVTDTSTGDRTPDWLFQGQVHVRFDKLKGGERIMYGALGTLVDTKIVVRGVPGIASTDRLRDSDGLIYEIVGLSATLRETEIIAVVQYDRGQ